MDFSHLVSVRVFKATLGEIVTEPVFLQADGRQHVGNVVFKPCAHSLALNLIGLMLDVGVVADVVDAFDVFEHLTNWYNLSAHVHHQHRRRIFSGDVFSTELRARARIT